MKRASIQILIFLVMVAIFLIGLMVFSNNTVNIILFIISWGEAMFIYCMYLVIINSKEGEK